MDFGGAIVVSLERLLSLKDCSELCGLSLFVRAVVTLSILLS
jgi:hypothetical protein